MVGGGRGKGSRDTRQALQGREAEGWIPAPGGWVGMPCGHTHLRPTGEGADNSVVSSLVSEK